MSQKSRALGLALLVIFVLAVLAVLLSPGRPPPQPPLPNPNGYDDFLKAAALLIGDPANASALNHDGLQALVSSNSESLRLVRLGLTRQCAFPADAAMTNFAGWLGELADTKRLVFLLAAKGRLREMDGQPAEAAQCYVDAIRFGNEQSRGGFIINRLSGIACEAMGTTPLSKLAPRLDTQQARMVIAELEGIDSAQVTWGEVRQNENRFAQYQLRQGFNLITWAISRWDNWGSMRRAEMRQKRIIAHVRLLTAELAVRCYRSEQGRAPTSLGSLFRSISNACHRTRSVDRQ